MSKYFHLISYIYIYSKKIVKKIKSEPIDRVTRNWKKQMKIPPCVVYECSLFATSPLGALRIKVQT